MAVAVAVAAGGVVGAVAGMRDDDVGAVGVVSGVAAASACAVAGILEVVDAHWRPTVPRTTVWAQATPWSAEAKTVNHSRNGSQKGQVWN